VRFNLILFVLVLVLVLEIRILWVARDEYEHEDDDEVLALNRVWNFTKITLNSRSFISGVRRLRVKVFSK